MTRIVSIDCSKISSWETLHDVFAEAFGFPDYYGRNANAWIECMSDLGTDHSDSAFKIARGETVMLALESAQDLKERSPALLCDILEMSAFANHVKVDSGEAPILCVSASFAD